MSQTHTPAEQQPRIIPSEMWEAIRAADTASETQLQHIGKSHRQAVIDIGDKFGFTKEQLIARGIIAPDPGFSPTALKGGR